MDHLEQTKRSIRLLTFGVIVGNNLLIIAIYMSLRHLVNINGLIVLAAAVGIGALIAWLVAIKYSKLVIQPISAIWQLILNLSPTEHGMVAPETSQFKFGQQLVASLSAQVYQLVNVADKEAEKTKLLASDLHKNFIAQNLPLPLIVLDTSQNIHFVNEAAAQYVGMPSEDMIGKNVYMVLDMSFPSVDTFDNWLKDVKLKNATAVSSWERVRLNIRDSHPLRLFDMAAYYNRDNTDQNETILVLFDHTKMYSQDEQAISFMALSVHELRTPLTLLRGYIEVFEDELGPALNEEQKDFMLKMHSQAEQLTDYVNNILNVARVDGDQLELRLQSGDWSTILKSAIESISLRAKVRGITLKCAIATDLPPVAVDNISIREVINNLIDNAIKYSGDSKVININAYINKEGAVETTIQDFGNGIPGNVMPNLFTKFYRDHRNRAQIGGTGLGLYLSKAIVSAHSGTIWVRSQEGQGSTFGFTLIPYTQLAEAEKNKGEDGVTRSAHGWIKNHSLYRR